MHRSRLFKTLKVLALSVALFSLSVADALAISDGSEWRFRLIQGANFGDGVELGSYKVGSKSYEMRSNPNKNSGLMLVVGSWGLGYYDFQTEINQTDALLTHKLDARFYEIGYLIQTAGNPSLTVGGGYPFSGKGTISYPYSISDLVSEEVVGYSWFAQLGLEYTLPVNLAFTGLEFAEVLLGFRQNYLEYSSYQSASVKIGKPQPISSSQFQFGLGFVF
jgi:hypothetical protein